MSKNFRILTSFIRTLSHSTSFYRPMIENEWSKDLTLINTCYKMDHLGRRQTFLRLPYNHINNVLDTLDRYNILMQEMSIKKVAKTYRQSIWIIEKKILLLEEMGICPVKPIYIEKFEKGMKLPVFIFKAHVRLQKNFNIAKNFFFTLHELEVYEEVKNNLNDEMKLWDYYAECLTFYIKHHLDADEQSIRELIKAHHKKLLFNSFRLLGRMINILKTDFDFTNEMILENWSLLGHHPEYALMVTDIMKIECENLNFKEIVQKYPRVLQIDVSELKRFLKCFRQYDITPEMIEAVPRIFSLKADVFESRVQQLLQIPYTLVFKNHPKFLLLVESFNIMKKNIPYLQKKNIEFATITSLTSYSDIEEQLLKTKKMNTPNIKVFLKARFKSNPNVLLEKLKKHPYYKYVSLSQMYTTLQYLLKHFPQESVERHVYALLYNKKQIDEIKKNLKGEELGLQSHQILPYCIYLIEKKYNFSGEGVLASEYPETIARNLEIAALERQEKSLDDCK